MKKVTVEVSENFYAFARKMARRHGYPSPEAYLSLCLNAALLRFMERFEGQPPLPAMIVIEQSQ